VNLVVVEVDVVVVVVVVVVVLTRGLLPPVAVLGSVSPCPCVAL